MFSANLVIKRWNGPKVKSTVAEAARRLAGSIAYDAQNEAKDLAHVSSGRMRGATTVVRPGSSFSVGAKDLPMDYGKDREGAINEVQLTGMIARVVVGSFVPYALVEEVLRGHRFIHPGLDLARGRIAERIAEVGSEVGLR